MNSTSFSSSSTFARRPGFPLCRLSFSLAASPRKITVSASNSCILGPTPIAMMWGGENLSASRRKTDRGQWSRVPARNRHCQRSKRGSQRFFVVSQSDLKERSGQGLWLEISSPENLVKDLIASIVNMVLLATSIIFMKNIMMANAKNCSKRSKSPIMPVWKNERPWDQSICSVRWIENKTQQIALESLYAGPERA